MQLPHFRSEVKNSAGVCKIPTGKVEKKPLFLFFCNDTIEPFFSKWQKKVPDQLLVCGKGNVLNGTKLIIDDQGGQFDLGIYNQLGIIQNLPRSPIPQSSNSSVTYFFCHSG